MSKGIPIFLIILSMVLIVLAFLIPVPSSILTDSDFMSDYSGYSVIDTYVGGDAYNYIIGANLVGAKITGIMVMRTTLFCTGIIVFSLGLLGCFYASCKEKQLKKLDDIKDVLKSSLTKEENN